MALALTLRVVYCADLHVERSEPSKLGRIAVVDTTNGHIGRRIFVIDVGGLSPWTLLLTVLVQCLRGSAPSPPRKRGFFLKS